ncbi:MAG: hypothetical protein EP318_09990 [Rhodobacteraceae bacterium]|nr:MAG: hypothetical protein EP318_09990 [Paracoccaceae bacterium]
MILREKPHLGDLLFAVRGSVFPIILPRLIGVSAIAAGIVAIDRLVVTLPNPATAPFAVFGIALSLFLGFRNDAAYSRWRGGRRLWGQIISDLRTLGRECEIFLPDRQRRHRVLRLALAFAHLHRINLRKLPDDGKARAWCDTDFSAAPHPPDAALNAIASELAAAARDGGLDGFGQKALTERLASLALAQAGCERIATTPLPYVYSLLIFRTTYLYCLLLPLALLGPAGWMTPVFVAVVAYVFFGLAEVTEELAHPFGQTVNGLALDAMCRTMEIAVAAHLDITPPEPLKPTKYYLS